ncbi:MAG: hypothetical protein WCT45_02950 [Candidatus Paceibacterota bacterium]
MNPEINTGFPQEMSSRPPEKKRCAFGNIGNKSAYLLAVAGLFVFFLTFSLMGTFRTSSPATGLATQQCEEKTFVAGPQSVPKVATDYIMCERRLWNTSPASSAQAWADAQAGLDPVSAAAFLTAVDTFFGTSSPPGRTGQGTTQGGHAFFRTVGQSGALSWALDYDRGDTKTKAACMGVIKVEFNCH